MLNQRQIEILLEMSKSSGKYLTASYFAEKLGVSLRTVQGDIKQIKEELSKEKSAKVLSVVPKGTRIQIENHEEFSNFVNLLYQKHTNVSLSYPTSRINQILLFLINQHRNISISSLEEKFYVSHSTLLNDLKKVDNILQEFDLELLKSKNRIIIDGSEINKRQYLIEKNTYMLEQTNENEAHYINNNDKLKIKNVLTEVFSEHKYYISDNDIESAAAFFAIMINRIKDGFYVKPYDLVISEELGRENEISKLVFDKVRWEFQIEETTDEINYFALYLKGHSNCHNSDVITDEIDRFIRGAFIKIEHSFGIDFTNNEDLYTSLALHCIPLRIRAKYNMQMKNSMLDYIKKTFPLGYDIGIYFALLFEEEYGHKLTDAETALIAVHFYSRLLEVNNDTENKKIIVISSLKNSMIILLRQMLYKWFPNNISVLDFVSPMDVNEDMLDIYDVFLTTEKSEYFSKGIALYINPFPNEHDYFNIKIMMDGFQSIDDILKSFGEDLFFCGDYKDKNEIIYELSKKASKKYKLDSLYDEVIKRENRGSTYFSEGIAMPHPMHAVSSDTFAAICIVPNGIEWDEDHNIVNVVVLVGIGKNNPQAFQLWDYFSKIFTDKTFSEKLLEKPTYKMFKLLVTKALKSKIRGFK